MSKFTRPTAIQTTDLIGSLSTIRDGVLRDPERVQYRGYVIFYDPKPIPPMKDGFIDWTFHHDSYDGPGDDRVGWGVSVADCKAQIDEQIEDAGLEGSTPVDDGEPSPHPDLVNDTTRAIEAGFYDECEPEDE